MGDMTGLWEFRGALRKIQKGGGVDIWQFSTMTMISLQYLMYMSDSSLQTQSYELYKCSFMSYIALKMIDFWDL